MLPEPKRPPSQLHLGMAVLADLASGAGVIERLLPIVSAYREWIAEQPRHPVTDPEQEATASHLARLAEECANRIEAGIRALSDPLVREAFRTMNLVMDQAQRQRLAFTLPVAPERFGDQPNTSAPAWRFFQLAFILMSLPGLADPSTPEGLAQRERVELLFFPTGGGKTEAYLGLSAFTLVLRRLRQPGITGAGLTVLMRYTLRLLTLDQLGRAATVICALELERQRRQAAQHPHPLGDWPFEIGMWVGKGASPQQAGRPQRSRSPLRPRRAQPLAEATEHRSADSDRNLPLVQPADPGGGLCAAARQGAGSARHPLPACARDPGRKQPETC
ncbi:MAG: hypothetical protein ACKPBV_18055 [Sphaerospermopsis kisseleviana]